MSVNEKLLKQIQSRQEKQTEFGYGILTADRHVQNLVDACGHEFCQKRFHNKAHSFSDCLQKAKNTLVYSNADLRVVDHKQSELAEIELPKNTLVVFKHVLTTPKKDRDGDVLRTEGAEVDPDMLLLWQHVHTLPIGKMLVIAEQNSQKLSLVSAIVDMNELCHDAAVMVDNDMARFSHGFRAFEFSELKEEVGETTSPGGFDIKKFEIMEESLVSVPANTDAQVEDQMLDLIEGGRMTSDLMKEYGKQIREHRNVAVSFKDGIMPQYKITQRLGDYEVSASAANADDALKMLRESTKETEEVQDENEQRSRTEEKEPGTTDSPEETKDSSEERQEAEIQEACDEKGLSGPLEGSWEWIENRLRSSARNYVKDNVVGVSDRDWCYLVATFADHAVVCVEKPEAGIPDEFRYFKIDWTMDDGNPSFTGTPQEVEIRVTADLIERIPSLLSYKSQKQGRRLSRAIINDLKEVRDDLDELSKMENMSRAGGALCKRCMDKLDAMMGTYEDEDSTEPEIKQITADEAQMIFLKTATNKQIENLQKIINSMVQLTKNKNRTAAIRRLFKS